MQSSEQKSGPPVEGSTFAEYPPTKSDNGIKSKESSSLDTGYTSSKIESKSSASCAQAKEKRKINDKTAVKSLFITLNSSFQDMVLYIQYQVLLQILHYGL